MRARSFARIAVVALVALLAAEIALRVGLSLASRERGVTYDAELGWRPLPNVERVGAHWGGDEPARTNSLGWRDDEFALTRATGVRRLLALGDSFTWGAGVDHGERWTEHLERALANVEVLNCGVNAFGCDQALRLLETHGLALHPDVVVAQVFLGNDFDDILDTRHFDWPKPHYELVDGELRLHPPERTWDVDLRVSSYLGEGLFRLVGRGLERNVRAAELEHVDSVELLAAILVRMARVASDADVKLLVVLAYPRERGGDEPVEREARLRERLTAAAVPLVDLRTAFAEHVANGGSPFLADGHWNDAGHALAAAEIARELSAHGWLD